jgi:hypothetical protein
VGYLSVSRRSAYKVVDDLEYDDLIEEVIGKERKKEFKPTRCSIFWRRRQTLDSHRFR